VKKNTLASFGLMAVGALGGLAAGHALGPSLGSLTNKMHGGKQTPPQQKSTSSTLTLLLSCFGLCAGGYAGSVAGTKLGLDGSNWHRGPGGEWNWKDRA
jgi:hypothetical protein